MPAGETESSPSPWTIDSLHEHLKTIIKAFEDSTTLASQAAAALDQEQDRRYEQRFIAQEQAVVVALGRVDKEFHEHLSQAREEAKAALENAEKAIAKAEAATERRFESVNEFRGQLADQATRFMPRLESLQRHEQSAEKIEQLDSRMREANRVTEGSLASLMPRSEAITLTNQNATSIMGLDKRLNESLAQINSRLDLTQGSKTGGQESKTNLYAVIGVIATVIFAAIAIIGFMAANGGTP